MSPRVLRFIRLGDYLRTGVINIGTGYALTPEARETIEDAMDRLAAEMTDEEHAALTHALTERLERRVA